MMELSNELAPYTRLTAAFLNPDLGVSLAGSPSNADPVAQWLRSPLNPRNRPNCLRYRGPIAWQLQGCASNGRRFLAIPHFPPSARKPRTGVDVFIPDQAHFPHGLRVALDAGAAFWALGSSIRRLPLCQFLASALSYWANSTPHFEALYTAMPLGTPIVVENFASDYRQMKIRFYPAAHIERRLLAMSDLLAFRWQLPRYHGVPPILHLEEVELVSQLHPSISTVTVPGKTGEKIWALKMRTIDPEKLYRELELLLASSPHPHIASPPAYLVAVTVTQPESANADPHKICGFLTEYHPLGDLGRLLEEKRESNDLSLELSYSLALQLTSALLALLSSPVGYYPNLKPDNVICESGGTISIIDLELSGTWKTFTAPEISYMENLIWLWRSPHLDEEQRQRCRFKLSKHFPLEEEHDSNSPYHKMEWPEITWSALSAQRREASMVYALGKMLWCIFEGWSHTVNTPDEEYNVACEWEFPTFRRTPEGMQQLILDCTDGGRPYATSGGSSGLVRLGSKVYPRGRSGQNGEPEATPEETVYHAHRVYTTELQRMDEYLEAMLRWEKGRGFNTDADCLGFPKRPRLLSVQVAVQQLAQEINVAAV